MTTEARLSLSILNMGSFFLCCLGYQPCGRNPLTLQWRLTSKTLYIHDACTRLLMQQDKHVLLHQRYCNRAPLKQRSPQWMNWKQQLTSILSSVLPFLLSSLIPRTNLTDDFSIIFLMLSVDDIEVNNDVNKHTNRALICLSFNGAKQHFFLIL